MQNHLQDLEAERALASVEGHAYTAAAVTEIAVLRAELSAPLLG